ncbi:MAG: 7-carboxy-7-deazaguanine synthase QueE [Pirellulales bacterium]|nr:7-carboxy-7-deazaguanine synthase QueE [Pirellulales bacterium]
MRIVEVYQSVQGEGLLTGTACVFVRASGCNLRCWFCDTPYASWRPEGVDLTIDEVVAKVEEWDCQHVVLTGGEPMLFSELIPLTQQLANRERHITIETAGTLYLPVACDLMSISPKLSSSAPALASNPHWHRRHQRERCRMDVIQRLVREYVYQLKFVVDRPADCQEIEEYLAALEDIDRERILLMPQGTHPDELADRTGWLAPYCQIKGYRFCPRKQFEWYGTVRGS